MKIFNISFNKIDIPIIVVDSNGNNVETILKKDCFMFTPTNEKTRSINLHGLKRNLSISFDDEKPEGLEYFVSYYETDLLTSDPVVEETILEVKNTDITKESKEPFNSIQDTMDFASRISEIEAKEEESESLFEKSKEAIGADEGRLYEELDLDAIKESVNEYIEEKPKPKRRTTKSKKGPGRPKKRGPKPKKRAPGRPKGSKNKPKPKTKS